MTTVGHSLVGVALALVVLPRGGSLRSQLAVIGACILAANAPDIPLPGWGHDHYFRSHSIWITVPSALLLAIIVTLARVRWPSIPRWLPLALVLAWCSHLVLDGMYNHGRGIIVGWPVDKLRIKLPVPWLATANLRAGLFTWHNVRVVMLELATFGPLVLLGLGGRWLRRLRQPQNE